MKGFYQDRKHPPEREVNCGFGNGEFFSLFNKEKLKATWA
jgi:hypothetical protein